ncbi:MULTISPECIES: TrbC/VirB2 family protein [Pseudomonas]|jgi:type IV secretion system protein VirB2|uniref:TrbC/VirB2 family protein n=1 Tax=Pseudomonas TaxID=286 RepID=UPI0009EE50D8|nr:MULTISPECIES: TrbC/VirB2 family protein [Pseudomonas]MDQ7915830.1 TrbC/VirB2 family protein [Pseudomonas sp. 102515]UUW74434.1 TrbC/VirB2 family protein [Pseudomonas psychrotolerans]UUW74486.1 TrbC/VirB2 family protein [Pseudomonas psychrotolerans]
MQRSELKAECNVGNNDKQNWRTWLKAKTATTLKAVFAQKTPSHKALMREDWVAKATKFAVLGSFLSLALFPEFANAAMDFSGLKKLAKDVVSFLIFDVGYYLGIAAIAFCGFQAKSGRMSWGQFGWAVAGVFLVFFAPNLVDTIKEGAQTQLK